MAWIIQRFICLGPTRRLITHGLVKACPVRQSGSMQRAAAWGIWSILKAMQIQATATTCPATFGKPVPTHNTATDGYAFTSPAHSFAANGYGLYGMASNVWDWKTDLFRIKPLSKS